MADHPLAGTVYKGAVIRTPQKMLTGSGAPSFCWQCGSQLQRAPGKGLGLFFFNLVTGPDGHQHRVHGDCTEQAILDGCRLVEQPAPGLQATGLSDFIRNASDERKAEVYGAVLDKVAERQQAVIASVPGTVKEAPDAK